MPTCTVKELATAAMELVKANSSFQKPLRSLGVRACDLIGEDCGFQMGLFDGTEKQVNREKVETCIDRLRTRFGSKSVVRATLIGANIVGESDPLTHVVHPVGFFR